MGNLNAADLIYAKALGCLDFEEETAFNKLMEEGDDFPWEELGQYQNLIALLPTLLDVEKPEQEIKDNVARKLYDLEQKRIEEQKAQQQRKKESMTQQIDTEMDIEKTTVEQIQTPPAADKKKLEESLADIDAIVTDENTKGEISFRDHGMPVIPAEKETGAESQEKVTETVQEPKLNKQIETPVKEKEPQKVKSYVSKYTAEPKVEIKKDNSNKVLAVILFVITLVALAIVYFKLSSDIDKNKNDIELLKNQRGSSFNIQFNGQVDIFEIKLS